MNDDKYYTPTINEFYVGFEYEYNKPKFKGDVNWIPCTFDLSFGEGNELFDLFNEGYQSTRLRVKYLDKEDIEKCFGFIIIKEQGLAFKARKPFNYKLNTDMELYADTEGYWEIIISADKHCMINKEHIGLTTFFKGKLKNKSELKKVLTFLQI